MIFSHWLYFLAAFLIVVGFLTIAVGVTEWWEWRKLP
jgi:hypothetical protein